MKVTAFQHPTTWTGEVTLTFESKLEAEVFLSLFNTGLVAGALRHVSGGAFDPSNVYNAAERLGCFPSMFVAEISEHIRKVARQKN